MLLPNTDIVTCAYLSVSLKRASCKYTNNACHYQRGKHHCLGGKNRPHLQMTGECHKGLGCTSTLI